VRQNGSLAKYSIAVSSAWSICSVAPTKAERRKRVNTAGERAVALEYPTLLADPVHRAPVIKFRPLKKSTAMISIRVSVTIRFPNSSDLCVQACLAKTIRTFLCAERGAE
jgi:hypothetical protein